MSDSPSEPIDIGIIMGSDSDLPTMMDAIAICEDFDIAHEVAIVSAHRTPKRMVAYAESAHTRGLKVIIAGAGGAAHLPGMVAALSPLPVIGVPGSNQHPLRHRFTLFDCADASGDSGCHSRHWQRQKRRTASSTDARCLQP